MVHSGVRNVHPRGDERPVERETPAVLKRQALRQLCRQTDQKRGIVGLSVIQMRFYDNRINKNIRYQICSFIDWSTSKSELQFRSKRSIRPVINRTTKSAGSISIGPIWSDHSVRQVLSRIGVAAKWRRIRGQTLVESDEPVLIQKQSALVVPFKSEWTSCSD